MTNRTIRLADERDFAASREAFFEAVQYYAKLKNCPVFFHKEVEKEVQVDGIWAKAYERVENKLEAVGLGRHYSEYTGYRVQKCRIQNPLEQLSLFK